MCRLEQYLKQNETLNPFKDDFQILEEEDIMFGNKSENYLKEFQSFTDFQYSKDKLITALDWQPLSKGVVAVACSEKSDIDTKVGVSKFNSSVILIWDFIDPIHPQVN